MNRDALSLRISRRTLISSGAAASLFAASGLGSEAVARAGGVLRVAVPDAEMSNRLIAPGIVFNCLCEVDRDGALNGEIAESWQGRAAGAVWALDLRRSATFHDGSAVGPADVTASLRHHVRQGGRLANVRSLRRTGADQVSFFLHAPDPQFPMVLADPVLVIRPGGVPSDLGSGPYRVAERGPGMRMKLERVSGHPREALASRFERVEILMLDDAGNRLAALTSGRVDLAFGLSPAQAREVSRLRRFRTAQVVEPDGTPGVIGHVARLHGLDVRDPFRIVERGFFV